MEQNAYTGVIQQQIDINDQSMIDAYNKAFPLKLIKTMDELPIPDEIVCESIRNTIELNIVNGENPFDIVKIKCSMSENSSPTLPTLRLELLMVNDELFDKMNEEMNISELLSKLGLEKSHLWYFWHFDTIKKKVLVDGQEMYMHQLCAYQL